MHYLTKIMKYFLVELVNSGFKGFFDSNSENKRKLSKLKNKSQYETDFYDMIEYDELLNIWPFPKVFTPAAK